MNHTSYFWVMMLLICPISWTVHASSTSSRKSSLHEQKWKQVLSQQCRIPGALVDKIQIYIPKHAGATTQFALAYLWTTWHKTSARWVFVSRYRCKTRGCYSPCVQLHEQTCMARSKPSCYAQFRVLQLIDLKAKETIVQPESGSWWGGSLTEAAKPNAWPVLLLQNQILRDTGDRQRTEIHTLFLSLQDEQQPRALMKLLTYERWPPVLIAGRKQDPVGRRVHTIQFQHQSDQPIELTTIERIIPSPFDRCCKPQDTYKRYQLAPQGFEVVHSL